MSDSSRKPPAGAERADPSRTRADWRGDYLDGRTARLQAADIRLMATGIEVRTESGATAFWPYGEIRQTQGFYAGEDVRLERGGELPEAVIVRDRAFVASLHAIGRDLGGRLYEPGRRRLRVWLTVGAGLAVVAIVAALYLWGIPLLATLAAERVPVAWEERLGASVVEQIASPAQRCTEGDRLQRIEAIVGRLAEKIPAPSPYRFRVYVLNTAAVNALAAPGGFIVVFRGLLERAESPEALAGVLAHEMEHVLQRHATKMLVQHASTGLLLVALTGDVTSVMAYGLESARVLGTLQYSRRAEDEADREGMKLLVAARIDPAGMIAFFQSLEKQGSGPSVPTYLSSHPRLDQRIGRLKELAREEARPASTPVKLLEDYDWRDIRNICPPSRKR